MTKPSNEMKVGILVTACLALIVGFSWLMGVESPFKKKLSFYVTYRFAGGIDVGSPVRVSGIKAGRVEAIEFFIPEAPPEATSKDSAISKQEPGSAENSEDLAIVPLRVKISIDPKATAGVRKDSRFYINIAGIIGERYIEVTPGTVKSESITSGMTVAGIDPPRIDQLLSQSFDLAGKITQIIEENKGDLTKSLELIYKLSGSLNKMLGSVDQSKLFKTDLSKLIENIIGLTTDLRVVTKKVNSPEGEKALKLMHELLWRLEPLNQEAVQKFFQEDGLKAKVRFF